MDQCSNTYNPISFKLPIDVENSNASEIHTDHYRTIRSDCGSHICSRAVSQHFNGFRRILGWTTIRHHHCIRTSNGGLRLLG